MAEQDYDVLPYGDISQLKKQLDGMTGRKDIPAKDMQDAMRQLAGTMHDMLEIFGAAAEQLKIEDKDYETDSKKHEVIISKLDKLIDQNKTIAEGMLAVVEMIKEKFGPIEKRSSETGFMQDDSEPLFAPKAAEAPTPNQDPRIFSRPQQEWKPMPEQMPRPGMQPPPFMPRQMAPMQAPDFGTAMPPMEPEPMPDFDMPEVPFNLDDEPKKKNLFGGMFKK